jgi:hypothetical protein
MRIMAVANAIDLTDTANKLVGHHLAFLFQFQSYPICIMVRSHSVEIVSCNLQRYLQFINLGAQDIFLSAVLLMPNRATYVVNRIRF